MKALTASALFSVGLCYSSLTLPMDYHSPGFEHAVHLHYHNSAPIIQEEIENNKKVIALFLSELRTPQDLYLSLPLQRRTASMIQIPAVFDLIRKKRNGYLLEILIAQKIPIEVKAQNSRGIFHELAATGKSKVMKVILDLYKKYDRNCAELIELQTRNLWTPLMMAATFGHTACVKLLLEHGARIYCLTKDLESALHLAVHNNHKRGKSKTNKIVNMLCKAGIEVNQKNQNKLTARSIACKNSLFEAAAIIDHYACQPSCDELRKKEASTYFSLLPPDLVLHALAMAILPCPEKVLRDQPLVIT